MSNKQDFRGAWQKREGGAQKLVNLYFQKILRWEHSDVGVEWEV